MGVGGQRHAPAALPPEKTRYLLYRRLGGPQDRSGRVRKISPPTGIRPPDGTARSELIYRLRYPGPWFITCRRFKGTLFPVHARKVQWCSRGITPVLTSSLYGGEGSTSHPKRIIRAEKVPGTHSIQRWVSAVTFWVREYLYTCRWCVYIHLKYTGCNECLRN